MPAGHVNPGSSGGSDPGAGRPYAGRACGRVEDKRVLGSMVWLTVRVPGWGGALPGQFALLQPLSGGCFLPRVLSIAGEDGEATSFLIAPVGRGTRELAALHPGDQVWILGPLGNGFPLSDALKDGAGRLLIVGGGAGVAPFPFLLEQVARARGGTAGPAGALGSAGEIVVLLGFRDAAQAEAAIPVLEAVHQAEEAGLACRCLLATEDGSRGTAGMVTALLAAHIRPHDRVVVCGPTAMAEAVWAASSRVEGVSSWYSLETGMACGVGSCHGCVVSMADGSLVRVCAEGPVFSGERIWGGGGSAGVKDESFERDRDRGGIEGEHRP